MGDLMSPHGDLIKDVTMVRIHDIIRSLSLKDQKSYLTTLLQNAKNDIDTLLSQIVCDQSSGGSRTLLWRWERRFATTDMSGYPSLFVTGGPLLFGAGYLGF